MIHGLFLDPRTWKIDFLTSPFWKPEAYGLKVDLHPNAFHIPTTGIDSKYKFVIATEVWEIPMQKTLEYLRNKGLKIFLVPREIAPTRSHLAVMFNHDKFKYKNNYYFTPDLVLTASDQYGELWDGRAPHKTVGYPRFDVYKRPDLWKTKAEIRKKHGIENKKIIFFPSYPPWGVKMEGGKHSTINLYDDLQNTLKVLEQYALDHPEVQIVSKIHPMSFKCYKKGIGRGDEVAGLLKKYYEHPSKHMKVLGDVREDSSASREITILADMVVGYTSMMMLEAIMIGKPVLHVKFEQCSQLKDTLEYDDDIVTAYHPGEVAKYLDDSDKLVVKDMKLVEKYLYKFDGQVCDRIFSTIKKYL